MTARATWKASERRIATALGGQRIPVTGIDRDGADIVCERFVIQAKLRRSLPAWLWRWLGGIVATAQPKGKIGLLILRTPRMRDADALVVLRMADWVELHGHTAPLDT
jgi:hypothetical protein